MRKVLLVEDMEDVHVNVREALEGKIILLSAYTILEAKRIFNEYADIDAIVIDACVPGEKINTLSLVREFRKKYNGPMIAISKIGDYQKQLIDAGCNERCKNKGLLPLYLIKLLHL